MTVSRSGKRGKPKMHYVSRAGRVRTNARMNAATKRMTKIEREARAFVARGVTDAWSRDVRPANENDNVAPLALKHGRYETHNSMVRGCEIIGLDDEIVPLVFNKTVTVIDGWIDDDVFARRHVRMIERARDLWRDIARPTHPSFDWPDPEERIDGYNSERAKNLLRRCRRLVGWDRWRIFENVVRWNEPTGIPGARLARLSEASVLAAQQTIREVADDIKRAMIL